MRYVAAYLLAVLGGKTAPSSADLEKILGSVGVEADGERLKKVIGELQGKSVDELIAQGLNLLLKFILYSESILLVDINFQILCKFLMIIFLFSDLSSIQY